MFSKSSVTPQRTSFSLTHSQIIEDIEAVSACEEQRNKLFTCIDDKVPQDRKYAEMEAFLKGTQKLEEIQEALKDQIKRLRSLAEGLSSSIDEIEGKIAACQ